MLNLIKYELRKTMGVKAIILVIMAIVEVLYLIGLYSENDDLLALGLFFLMFGSFTSIIIIGIQSIKLLRVDLNTKQSYMLFMTPNSSYKILGAKMIENGISIILGGAFFIFLAIIDFSLIVAKYGELLDFIDFFNLFMFDVVEINMVNVVSTVALMIIHWLYIVSVAFFAIIFVASILNGKKFNRLIGFCVFLVINFIVSLFTNYIGEELFDSLSASNLLGYSIIMSAIYLLLAAGMYFINAWIMDNKLSV